MRSLNTRRFMGTVSLAAMALAMAGAASAQTAAPAPPKSSTDDATVVVVTGHAGGTGVKKLEAGYSITTLSHAAIDILAPKTTGELLTAVPGVWVESSGGTGTSNIFVRGIPSTGDAPFVTMQFDGIPVFGANSPSFMDQTALVYMDETVGSVEAVNGGPASTFSDGQPGLTTNLLLREGSDESSGDIKVSTSGYNQKRIDGYLSGKIADDLYFMVGGFATSGDTVRKTDFDTEVGHQFTVNITKKFDGGKLDVFARSTDDHGEWYLPFATNVPGINVGTYNPVNNYTRYQTIIVPGTGANGPTEQADMGDGRGWKGTISGANYSQDFGGVSFSDKFGYTDGFLDTNGLVNQGAGALTVAQALAAGDGTAGQTVVKGVDTNQALASGDFVQNYDAWLIIKHLRALTNDASLTFNQGNNKITAGYYYNHFSSDDAWSLGSNSFWVQVGGADDIVNLARVNGAGGFNITESGTADVNAFYLADSWEVTDALRLDGAVRSENQKVDYLLLNAPTPQEQLDINQTKTAWTAGANYKFTSNFDAYARISDGWHMPSFDDVRSEVEPAGVAGPIPAFDLPWEVKSTEAGVKFHNHEFDADATIFGDQVIGAVYNDVGVPPEIAGSKTTGLEFDGRWSLDNGFSIVTNDDWESPKTNAPGTTFNGNQAVRIPKYQYRVTPTFMFHISGDAKATLYGTYSSVGERYSDLQNDQPLPAYSTISAGFIVEYKNLTFQLAGDNLTNSHGLTEGDPRIVGGGNAYPDVRPIFGRSVTASVKVSY